MKELELMNLGIEEFRDVFPNSPIHQFTPDHGVFRGRLCPPALFTLHCPLKRFAMNQSPERDRFPWSEWMESAARLWVSAAQNWQELYDSLAEHFRTDEYMRASLSVWRAFLPPWAGVQPQHPSFNIVQSIMQVLGTGGLSQELFKWLWNKGEIAGFSFDKSRQEAANAWMGVYEKAIQPLLKIPEVGLARVYQEKINRLTGMLDAYEASAREFQTLLSVPMQKSFADMREEFDRLRQKGEPEGNFKVFYGTWLKVLENHYMALFKSDEYRLALSRLLDETAALRITGNEVLSELLESLPIPTNKEMEVLYKELYALKKQTREAAKKINRMESALAKKDIQ